MFVAKYKLGEKVRVIRKPPVNTLSRCGYWWVPQMNQFCGKTLIIEKIKGDDDVYYLAQDIALFAFAEEWLEPTSSDMKNFLECGDNNG